MDKKELKAAITALAAGAKEKTGVLILFTHDCPAGHYRTGLNGETLITAAEAERLSSEYEIVVTFNKATNDKLQKS